MLNKYSPFEEKIIDVQDNYIYVYIRIYGRYEDDFWEHGGRVDVSHVEY